MKHLLKYRRDLHKIPEIGRKEFKTRDYLLSTLKNMGHEPKIIFNTGVYIYLDYGNNETIMFRSDIDALKVKEKNIIDYSSEHDGYMHACGHDGHMSMLLGFAEYLKDQTHFNKNVLLIFQPAEEGPGGAEEIVKTGIMKELNVVEVYGIHLFPNYDEGKIVSKSGYLMGAITLIDIEVIGESAHVAMRGEGIDALYYGSLFHVELMKQLDTKVADSKYILKFGSMNSGTARNIVSNNTTFEGTLRTLDEESRLLAIDTINHLATKFYIDYGVKINVSAQYLYPAVNNDASVYKRFKSIISDDFELLELEEPLMISEDFSFYQKEAKGVFYFIGTKNEDLGFTHLLHNDKFNFNEDVLNIGVKTYIKLINSY